jgi:hypothetical protein
MHLLRGIAASPPPLDPQVLLGCWPVVEFPLGFCCFGAKEICWHRHGSGRSGETEVKAPSSWILRALQPHVFVLSFVVCLVCALRGCAVTIDVTPSRLMTMLI